MHYSVTYNPSSLKKSDWEKNRLSLNFCPMTTDRAGIRGLCFMKLLSETLQNLPYFWNMKTQIDFFISHFEQLWIIVDIFLFTNPQMLEMKNNKNSLGFFLFQKYGKF